MYENGQTVSGIQGDSAKIVISGNSVFENIYAGGLNGGYDGSVTIEITKGSEMQIGSIYGSGADETPLKEGDWFNVKEEPAPPSANSGYTVSGQVSVQFNRIPATAVDGTGAQSGMSVSAATEYPNSTLKLRNISRLAVTEGTLQPAEITDSDMADVQIHSGATLDLSKANFGSVNNFYGGGTVVIGDTDTLVLSGEVTGRTNFETPGGFNGVSGTVQLDYCYIEAPNSDYDSFAFVPHAGQSNVKLKRTGEGSWYARDYSSGVDYLTAFYIDTRTIKTTKGEINGYVGDAASGGAAIGVRWKTEAGDVYFSDIPLGIEVVYNGISYPVTRDKCADDDGNFTGYEYYCHELNMAFTPDGFENCISIDNVLPDGYDGSKPYPYIETGTYLIKIKAPTRNRVIRQECTLNVAADKAEIIDNNGKEAYTLVTGRYRATAVIEEKYEDAALILAKYVGGVMTEITIKKISGTEAAENEHVIRVQTEPVNINESDYETGVYLRAYIWEDFLTIKPIGGTASVYSKKQSETGGGIVGEGEEVGGLW